MREPPSACFAMAARARSRRTSLPGWPPCMRWSSPTKLTAPLILPDAPMRQSCLQCHTTGFSANTNVADGGFSSMQLATGWTIPAVLTNGNYVSMQQHYPTVAALANVQCESCHGPGSMHLTTRRQHQFHFRQLHFRRLQPMPRRRDPSCLRHRMAEFRSCGVSTTDPRQFYLRGLPHRQGFEIARVEGSRPRVSTRLQSDQLPGLPRTARRHHSHQ